MIEKFKIDSLDKKILGILMNDSRTPFLEISRKCGVSGAAIHQRIQKMQDANIISGYSLKLNPYAMGYETCAFIGVQINLKTSRTHDEVFSKIMQVPEVVEAHHISGKYSLLLKIYTKNNKELKNLIVEKIQSIPEINYTETFVSLEEGFSLKNLVFISDI